MNPSVSDPSSIDDTRSFGFAVRRAHRAFDRALHRRLARHGVAPGNWYYLRALWDEDGLTQKQLSDRTGVAENTTAVMIAAMMKDGLVTRTRSTDDKRKWRIALTPHAWALREELFPYVAEVNGIAGAGIAAKQQALFLDVIERMAANLGGRERGPVGVIVCEGGGWSATGRIIDISNCFIPAKVGISAGHWNATARFLPSPE